MEGGEDKTMGKMKIRQDEDKVSQCLLCLFGDSIRRWSGEMGPAEVGSYDNP
jgi:hypothetical protein